MSQMSAATFRVLRAHKNKKERMNEISYTDLMLALRNRADREHRELLETMRHNVVRTRNKTRWYCRHAA